MKTLIFDYSPTLIERVKGFHIVVKFNDLNLFMQSYRLCMRQNHVDAFILNLPLSSLSQIEVNEMWVEIDSPIVLYIYNIGEIGGVFHQLELLKKIQLRIFLSSTYKSNYYGLKILSSLGIDCGLYIQPERMIDNDLFEDLVSYYYMSQVPHAKIEPFDYIATSLTDEKNISFDHVYFRDDTCFLLLDEDLKLYSSETGQYICMLAEYNEECEFRQRVSLKMEKYYSHFLNLDRCCKCSAFRICSGTMNSLFPNCEKTMNACLEDCLVFINMKNNKN